MSLSRSTHHYGVVPDSDKAPTSDCASENVNEVAGRSESEHRLGTNVCIAIIAVCIFATILVSTMTGYAVGILSSPQSHDTAPQTKRLSCGNSSTQAQALGCAWDPLTQGWLHKDCPRDGTQEFINHRPGNPWQYWYDEEQLYPIPDYDTQSKLDPPEVYWTTRAEHWAHCGWLAVRAARVKLKGGRVDSSVGNIEHAEHCAKFLMEGITASEQALQISDQITMAFLEC